MILPSLSYSSPCDTPFLLLLPSLCCSPPCVTLFLVLFPSLCYSLPCDTPLLLVFLSFPSQHLQSSLPLQALHWLSTTPQLGNPGSLAYAWQALGMEAQGLAGTMFPASRPYSVLIPDPLYFVNFVSLHGMYSSLAWSPTLAHLPRPA